MVDGKFGTDTYELNCHFLTRNKVKLEEWFESAAHWWCSSVPEDRRVLLHAAKAMEEVLYWLFGLAAKVCSLPHSLSRALADITPSSLQQ